MKNNKSEGSIVGLLPMFVFLVLFIGAGLVTKDFNSMPVNVAFIISGIVAVLMNKNLKLETKIDNFCKGAGEPNILLMSLIFILAGAFANVARDMGAVESTVNLGLSFLPGNVLVAGLFIIACFISVSIGTSMGTIVSLVPIAVGLSEQTGIITAICVAAVVGGAMFGDNLSMISDTTIAAARTQGCEMKDKFNTNFKIILPAVIITTILFTVITLGQGNPVTGTYNYNLIKILPYVGVLALALMGMNVLVVLVISVVFAGCVGLAFGDFTPVTLLASISKGIIGMEDLVMIALLIGGLVEIIKANKGLDYLINLVGSKINSKKGAELGIAFLVSAVNMCTGNNTISIVMVGPLAKDISEEYGIEPKRTASMLDIFSASIQGMIPYGGQLLVAASLASISTFEIMKYNFYPYLMIIFALLVILFISSKTKYNQKTSKANSNL